MEIKKEEGIITVSKTYLNQEEQEIKKINIRPFVTEVAHIGCSMGATINLGNYESAKIHVSLTFPCYKEEIIECFNQVRDFVEDTLNKELQLLDQKFELKRIDNGNFI